MIEVYKAINQYYDKNTTITFYFDGNSVTRGNKYKLMFVNMISGGTFYK